jgi:hypothetical protein
MYFCGLSGGGGRGSAAMSQHCFSILKENCERIISINMYETSSLFRSES